MSIDYLFNIFSSFLPVIEYITVPLLALLSILALMNLLYYIIGLHHV